MTIKALIELLMTTGINSKGQAIDYLRTLSVDVELDDFKKGRLNE